MAVGLVMNSGMANNSSNYDRSSFRLDFSSTSSSTNTSRLRHWDLSPTDSSPIEHQPPNQSMLASPGMNMPILCRSYNPYSPASVVQSLASPSSSFVHSPGESSTYSASPIHSPQQQMPAEDYMRYSMRQAFQPRHPLPPPVEYGFYYNEYGLKRRKRDDELSPEEYEKRRVRRERNKQAALRCRTRRRERIDALEQETSQIEEDNEKVETEINSLKKQIEELHTLLKEHSCNKHGQSSTSQTMKST